MIPAWAPHLPPGVDPASVNLLADGSLPRAFAAAWRAGDLLQDVDGRWLTGEELDSRTADAARRLGAAGLLAGDRIVVCAGTSADLVVAYVGALRAGLTVVPVNSAYTEGEVTRIVQAARPAAAVVDDASRGSWIAAAGAGVVSGIDLGALPASGAGPIDAAGPDDPALLLYTSGTTGAPKGALLTHGNLLSSAQAVRLAWRWTPEDRLLLTLPLFHMHGLGVGLHGSLVSGGQIVLRPAFDAGDVAARAGEGVTMFFGVPAMYQRLATGGRLAALSGLRLLVSGSAPLSSALAEEVAAATGQMPLERYGMTETVMITSNLIDGPRKPGKVGLPFPGVSVRLGEGDEIEVRGPNVLSRYDGRGGRDDWSVEAFTSDGWFRTGDLGEFDDDGHLRIAGRSKELIISGGFNVHPREVEEAVAEFPGVAEVAVVGRASEQWGEAVTAVVVADGVVDPVALRAFAAARLAPYKVPKAIEFVDELPRNALGKIVRGEL